MKKIVIMAFAVALAATSISAADPKSSDNKNITVVSTQSTVDGKSQVSEKLLEECIVSLPSVQDLEAEVTSSSAYVKEINGDPKKNDWVKMYAASIEINYMLHQQSLIIVTTASVQGQEPVMKVVEKSLAQSKRFESNPTEGGHYAGRSDRQYYFPTAEAAIQDVKNRAAIWLKQQSAIVCKGQTYGTPKKVQ
ncbi:MAG: hypothetical protein JW768_00685 [Chitinispirillaceae bacterium]|nr:hypothetical protein [Chitinispirillaceae bacterium]